MIRQMPASAIRVVLVGGAPFRAGSGAESMAPPESMWAMSQHSSSVECRVPLGARVAQELVAALLLVVLPDATGRGREGGQRAQEAAVRLVLPRHRAVPLPAVAAQQVEAAVVADAGIRVRRHVVCGAVRQRLLGERRPRQRRLRMTSYDVGR